MITRRGLLSGLLLTPLALLGKLQEPAEMDKERAETLLNAYAKESYRDMKWYNWNAMYSTWEPMVGGPGFECQGKMLSVGPSGVCYIYNPGDVV